MSADQEWGWKAEVYANLCPSTRKPRVDGARLGWPGMDPAQTYANLGWVGGGRGGAPRSGDPVIGESADPENQKATPDELCKPFRFLIGVQGEGGTDCQNRRNCQNWGITNSAFQLKLTAKRFTISGNSWPRSRTPGRN